MIPFRIAAATRHFGQPLPLALKTAAEFGARGVQLEVRNEFRPSDLSETGRRQFSHQITEHLLSISAFEFPTRRAFYDQDSLDARVAGLKASLEFAYQLKTSVVVGRIGRIPEDPASPSFELLVHVLNDIARQSNRVGSTFAITPTTDSPEIVTKLLDLITDGPIGINFDVGGIAMAGGDPTKLFRAVHDRVLAVQIRDGLRDIDGQGQEVPVGRGEVAWDEILALLHEGGYRNWLTVSRSVGDDRIGDMSRAVKFLHNVLGG